MTSSNCLQRVQDLIAHERHALRPENFQAAQGALLSDIVDRLEHAAAPSLERAIKQCFDLTSQDSKRLRFTRIQLLVLTLQYFLSEQDRRALLNANALTQKDAAEDFTAVNQAMKSAGSAEASRQTDPLDFKQSLAIGILTLAQEPSAIDRTSPMTAHAIKHLSTAERIRAQKGGFGTAIALRLIASLKADLFARNQQFIERRKTCGIMLYGSGL